MRKLGISIYPEKSTIEEIFAYLKQMRDIGASRIFSCLLSVNKPADEIKKDFTQIHTYAKELGYEIILDVNPNVFRDLGISYTDLRFFHDIHADGIRMDGGFTGFEEATMTYNPYGLKVEINMSTNTHTIDTIMDFKPNRYQLCACHNFYPHDHSGLDLDFFVETSKKFRSYGLTTAAFIGTLQKGAFGPWPTTDGLVTLEMHRHLPIDVQLKHLVALDSVDDIIIANCYPSKEEVEALKKVRLDVVNFHVELEDNIPEVEKKIVLEELHCYRGDVNPCYIRSSQSRVKYRGHQFDVFNAPNKIRRGDILIDSSLYGSYAGELQIALTDMDNDGRTNVVGHIREDEQFILDCLQPWQRFVFTN
ncbi:MAG: MupG family TIM beta-alpha barrel fold protein [Erysipelotrichaceae bacterium]|nr:MupG family TIM beta-alpha barrel fold protein [Erysipelotrichaceae bacterium]